jgi:V-type H+-transporting ATPase proteolipid subunit
MSVDNPQGIMKNLLGIIMAGVLGIFGLIVAIIIGGSVTGPNEDGATTYSEFNAWAHLAAGLCCGGPCLAAGYATGIAGESNIIAVGIRASGNRAKSKRGGIDDGDEGDAAKLYIAGVTILSFAGATGLYGFIVSLIIVSSSAYSCNSG